MHLFFGPPREGAMWTAFVASLGQSVSASLMLEEVQSKSAVLKCQSSKNLSEILQGGYASLHQRLHGRHGWWLRISPVVGG